MGLAGFYPVFCDPLQVFNRWAPRAQHPTLPMQPALGKYHISFVLGTAGFLPSAVMAVLGAFGLRATAVPGAWSKLIKSQVAKLAHGSSSTRRD